MRETALGGVTIRTALIVGFGLTVALWLVTGYQFTQGIADVERESAEMASRYVRAQEALASLRPHVLAASGIVRDSLLDRTQEPALAGRDLEERLGAIDDVVTGYTTAIDSDDERARLGRLTKEASLFADTLRRVFADGAAGGSDGRSLFNRDVLPRRTELLRVTEDLQSLNRAAFLQYQTERTREHSEAEGQARRHLGWALLFSVAIAALATLYSGRLEKRLRSQLLQDAVKTRALQDLSIKMIRVQEDERRRIARELHDEVGQALTAIKVELSLAQRAIGAADGEGSPLHGAQSITDGALHTVRDLSRLLHPAVLDDLGLPEAVDAYLREFSKRFAIKTELRLTGMASRLAPDIELAAYRMIQEALTNVAKHARAGRCDVTLQRSDDQFEVLVRDDGEGFSVTEVDRWDARTGLGLIGMRERALQLAGMVSVDSVRGQGTTLRIVLPSRLGRRERPEIPTGLVPAGLTGPS